MEIIENRFNDFKSFLLKIAPDVQEVGLFSALVPLDMFLETLYLRAVTNSKTVDQLVDHICAKVNVSKDSFTPKVIAKFARYIEYFIDVAHETQD